MWSGGAEHGIGRVKNVGHTACTPPPECGLSKGDVIFAVRRAERICIPRPMSCRYGVQERKEGDRVRHDRCSATGNGGRLFCHMHEFSSLIRCFEYFARSGPNGGGWILMELEHASVECAG